MGIRRIADELDAWLIFGSLALALAVIHALIDAQVGMFGPVSSSLSGPRAALLLFFGLLFAWWALSIGMAMSPEPAVSGTGLFSLLFLVFVWSLLANGVVGILSCLPSCADAYPYQDLAHYANIVIGGAATITAWRRLKATGFSIKPTYLLFPVALSCAVFLLESVVFYAR
jgi:hypothetical protein